MTGRPCGSGATTWPLLTQGGASAVPLGARGTVSTDSRVRWVRMLSCWCACCDAPPVKHPVGVGVHLRRRGGDPSPPAGAAGGVQLRRLRTAWRSWMIRALPRSRVRRMPPIAAMSSMRASEVLPVIPRKVTVTV